MDPNLWSDFCLCHSWIQRHSQMQPRIHELDGALGLDRSHGCVHILWHNIAAWAINPKPDSRLLRLQLSGHPGGTSCSRPCTCRAEDRTCYYLVVAATTYLSPKRGLEAKGTCMPCMMMIGCRYETALSPKPQVTPDVAHILALAVIGRDSAS